MISHLNEVLKLTDRFLNLKKKLLIVTFEIVFNQNIDYSTLMMVQYLSLKYLVTKKTSSFFNLLLEQKWQETFKARVFYFQCIFQRQKSETQHFLAKLYLRFFSKVYCLSNGEKRSTTNAKFARKGFIKTVVLYVNDAKKTLPAYQSHFLKIIFKL